MELFKKDGMNQVYTLCALISTPAIMHRVDPTWPTSLSPKLSGFLARHIWKLNEIHQVRLAKGTNIMEFCGFAKQTKAYQLMYSGSFHPKPKIQIFTLVSIHLGFFIWEFLSLFGTPAICILLGFIRGRLLHEPSHPIGESVLLRSRWPWPGAMPRETHAVAFLWLSSLERLCASGCAKV